MDAVACGWPNSVATDVSKTQDEEVGDGTTSVAVLCGELLREAEQLTSQKIHPQTIIRGWRRALDAARAALTGSSEDNSKDAGIAPPSSLLAALD